MEKATDKLRALIVRSKKLGIKLTDLPAAVELKIKPKSPKINKKQAIGVTILIIAILCGYFIIRKSKCLIEMPDGISSIFRPPTKCDFCINKTSAVYLENVNPNNFEDLYAYTGGPTVIVDATVNWTANNVFDFWYFKEVYGNFSFKTKKWNCQFFPYKTTFKDLHEALNIPRERVLYQEGTEPWYFGWSNCNNEVGDILRQHYDRPYFLPETSENAAVDWIFMGGPGLGAHMHVDNVRLPSWQAQIKGAKVWTVAPPPECYFSCNSFEVPVNKGDIIVLDTNKWYHKTKVLPGEISITIGAEYD